MPVGSGPQEFLCDLVEQVRASDTYGRFDRFDADHLLRPFLVAPVVSDDLPVACVVDAVTEERLRAFFRAVAAGVERSTGLVTSYVLDLSHEGFAWAVVLVGRLVVLAEGLRDVHYFGFPSTGRLAEHGADLVVRAAATAAEHPGVARVQP